MSVSQAQQIVIMIGGIATVVWLVHVALWWWFQRGRSAIQPVTRRLDGLGAAAVREMLPRAAALQHPAWDLVGGDGDGAIFDVSVNTGRVTMAVTLEDEGSADEPVCAARCEIQRAPNGWLRGLYTFWVWVVIPVGILALGAVMWRLAGHASPVARGQVWQMAQLVQLMWEPFLFLGLQAQQGKLGRQQAERFLDALSLL